jgi:hypothetical protein
MVHLTVVLVDKDGLLLMLLLILLEWFDHGGNSVCLLLVKFFGMIFFWYGNQEKCTCREKVTKQLQPEAEIKLKGTRNT